MQRASRLLGGVRAAASFRIGSGSASSAASFSTGPNAARSASETVHGKIDLETVSSAAMRRRLRASSAAADSPPRALVEAPPRAEALVDAPPPSAPAPGMAATLGANLLFGFAMTVAFTGVIGLVRAIGF